jgi:peroxiredoxin Q/BCP
MENRAKTIHIMKRLITHLALLLLFLAVNLHAQVNLGDKVPNFKAIDQEGDEWVLKKELRTHEYLVVYFYPAAFTGGCTKQACSYRDYEGELKQVNAGVVGVSGDKPGTLDLFAVEHGLNFTLLSDEAGEIADLFGVPRKEGGAIQREVKGKELDFQRGTTIQRWTFILDSKGNLIYRDEEVDATADGQKVVEFLSTI